MVEEKKEQVAPKDEKKEAPIVGFTGEIKILVQNNMVSYPPVVTPNTLTIGQLYDAMVQTGQQLLGEMRSKKIGGK